MLRSSAGCGDTAAVAGFSGELMTHLRQFSMLVKFLNIELVDLEEFVGSDGDGSVGGGGRPHCNASRNAGEHARTQPAPCVEPAARPRSGNSSGDRRGGRSLQTDGGSSASGSGTAWP